MLNIANIQHFSVGDGPGIRTTVFFKGCNLHCPWCHNPETISGEPTKMHYRKLNKTEICGKKMSVDEIVNEVLEDKDYYEESGGGVTLSGGEVMLQTDKALALIKQMKEEGISVIIDTAGNVPYTEFRKINDYVDEYLYDYKVGSSEMYENVIGGNLTLVHNNLKLLLKDGKKVRVRIPLIPDFNTDSAAISQTCCKLQELGIEEVDLLPFHRMGAGKYEAMGREYLYKDMPPLMGEELKKIEEEFSKYFRVTVEL